MKKLIPILSLLLLTSCVAPPKPTPELTLLNYYQQIQVQVDTYKNTNSIEAMKIIAPSTVDKLDKVQYFITGTKLPDGKNEFILTVEFARARDVHGKTTWLFLGRPSTKVYLQGGTELKIEQETKRIPQCGVSGSCLFTEELKIQIPNSLIEKADRLNIAVYANETYSFSIPATYIEAIKLKAQEIGMLPKSNKGS